MRIVISWCLVVMVLLAAAAQADDEKEKKIGVSECPKAVQKTLKKEAAKGKIIDVDVREIKGVSIYESEVRYGDLEYDIVIRGDGTLLAKRLEQDGDDDEDTEDDDADGDDDEEVETLVKMADLPKVVQRTLRREARGGEIEEIEKETEDGKVVYEAGVEYETKSGELEYEITIAEDGTLVGKVLEEDDEDDDDDEQGDDDDDDDDDDEDEEDEEDDD